MNHPSTDQGVRPGFLVAVVGSIAVTVALIWVLKGKPAPADVAVETAAAVVPAPSAKPAAAFNWARRADATPVAVTTERPRWTGATRLSMTETGTDTTAPGAATGLAGFEGTEVFDYRTQAAQVAEVVRNAIAQEEGGGAGGRVYPVQPGPAELVPKPIVPTDTGGDATSTGSAPRFAGSPGADNYDSPARSGLVAEGVRNGLTPPELGGDATSSRFAVQVSQGSGPPGAHAVNNAVEAYREGERIRRAYVEEMRVRRIVTIVDARQREGI